MIGPVSKGASIEHNIYQMLTKVFILLDDSDGYFFAEYGLSTRQFWALQHLDQENGCSMIDLSRLLLTDKSNVTGIVDRLESMNLARRTASRHDRRVTLITLTTEGSQLRDVINEQHDERIRQLLGVLQPEKQRVLLEALEEIGGHIETYLTEVKAATNK